MDSKEKTQMVQDCQTIEELKSVFDQICPVQGSKKSYDAEKLKSKVSSLEFYVVKQKFQMDAVQWNLLTRTHGIRAKTMELLYYAKKGI
jgi:hypothetical protein